MVIAHTTLQDRFTFSPTKSRIRKQFSFNWLNTVPLLYKLRFLPYFHFFRNNQIFASASQLIERLTRWGNAITISFHFYQKFWLIAISITLSFPLRSVGGRRPTSSRSAPVFIICWTNSLPPCPTFRENHKLKEFSSRPDLNVFQVLYITRLLL